MLIGTISSRIHKNLQGQKLPLLPLCEDTSCMMSLIHPRSLFVYEMRRFLDNIIKYPWRQRRLLAKLWVSGSGPLSMWRHWSEQENDANLYTLNFLES